MDKAASAKIAVLGAGLIGVYVGGRLAAAGGDVTLIGRPRVTDDIRANGLRLTDLHGADIAVAPERLRLSESPEALREADLILLTVKSPATDDAACQIDKYARPGTVVLSLQNGVSNAEQLRRALPLMRVVAGMVPFNVAQPGPGHYHQGTGGQIHAAAGEAIAPYAPLFAAAGLSLTLAADMAGVLWGKLIINLNNAINALSGATLLQQLSQRDFRRCVAMSQKEALGLLRRIGIKPAKVLALPTPFVPYVMGLPDNLYRRVMARGGTRVDRHARSSMADDLAMERRTEVDYLNGEVVALAERLGRKAPVNARIVELVRRAEMGGEPWKADDLYRELRAARAKA